MNHRVYQVFLTPERVYDLPELIYEGTSITAARKAAKAAVAGMRGATECGVPACADAELAFEAWSNRDGDDDSPTAWIE